MWPTDLGGTPADVSSDDVAEVRALLRRADASSRRAALDRMESWVGMHLGPGAASAVLRAATQSYPWLRGERTDPADRFVVLLQRRPDALSVAEVEGAYLIASDRVRRSLLHLLALRRDRDGLASLGFLLGPDGPTDLLPLPVAGLLDPVLDVAAAPRLVPALVSVATRRGWAWHAADLLRRLTADGRLDDGSVDVIVAGVVPLVVDLVDSCDRSEVVEGDRGDPTLADRHRLRALTQLLAELPSDGVIPALRRMLAAVDPRIAAHGAVALVACGLPVAPDRLALVARHPEARFTVVQGLQAVGRLDLLAPAAHDGRHRAESDLVRWLSTQTELGRMPDEMEHVQALRVGTDPSAGAVHLFRFRLRPPHWSCARGWMIGAAGPYLDDGTVGRDVPAFASSNYAAEDEDDPAGHLDMILESLVVWPDPDDG